MSAMRHLVLFLCLSWALAASSSENPLTVRYLYAKPEVTWWPLASSKATANSQDISGSLRLAMARFPRAVQQLGEVPPDHNWLEQLQMPLMIHDNQHWRPGIASRWGTSPEGQLIIEIDSAARWSDGVSITVDDVVFTLQQQQRMAPIAGLQSVDVLSPKLAALTFAPETQERTTIAQLRLLPKHYYDAYLSSPDSLRWQAEPTSGPYYIDAVQPGRSITLRRTPGWWAQQRAFFKGRFNIASVRLQRIDPSEQWAALIRGEIDWLEFKADPSDTLQQRARYFQMQLWQVPTAPAPYVVLTTHQDNSSLRRHLDAYFAGEPLAGIEFHPSVQLLHPSGQLRDSALQLQSYLQQQGFQVNIRSANLIDTRTRADIVLTHVQNPQALSAPHWPLTTSPSTVLAWEWIQVAANAPSTDLWDIHRGGHLFIDARRRNTILSRPERRTPQAVHVQSFIYSNQTQHTR
ncbi:hypothetical protein CHH28_13970 [Bacterioplanes sanyensis]|uniref:Solute-binding protein family 5 domain-containing protein n=1 Tax=Bacterioplanes sanyensis TaxID=1249553 RepID=A0A222FNB8_9GAMM|nr:ABC transporter substrate-binding protein [Bacterioplanes sanyensis]ASP39713.1 hypothetical protein CHH28_13970 [Bacterioplanes sanyensis]